MDVKKVSSKKMTKYYIFSQTFSYICKKNKSLSLKNRFIC